MKGQHYYDQLTPEQQRRFKENMNKQRPGEINMFMGFEYDSLKKFIYQGFTWEETLEGNDYWYNIAHNLPVPVPVPVPAPEPTRPYNSGVMLGLFIGVITGTLLSMATRDWTYQLIGLDILLMAGIVYLYRRYRNEHPQGR